MTNRTVSGTGPSIYVRGLAARFTRVISVFTFILGIALMLIATGREGAWWGLIGNLGAFVAAAVAIPFYYELVLRDAERNIVREELSTLLKERLDPEGSRCVVHAEGRWPVSEKRDLIRAAEKEVCEIGIALRSLVSYFDQRPDQDFAEPVRELLTKGVNFTYVLLDPDCEWATAYARAVEDPDLTNRIRTSINRLKHLAAAFAREDLAGRFEIRIYQSLPACSMLMIDPKDSGGRTLVAPYLQGIKRASSPVLEINRKEHPGLFDKYATHWHTIRAQSRDA